MYVPCDGCRDCDRCYRFNAMHKDAALAFAEGAIVECSEYREAGYYVAGLGSIQRGPVYRRASRYFAYVPVLRSQLGR